MNSSDVLIEIVLFNITSSGSLLNLWIETGPPPAPLPSSSSSTSSPAASAAHPPKALAVCNPLAGTYRLLPPLGFACAHHGIVLVGPGGVVLVLTELVALSYSPSEGSGKWMKHPLSLPYKSRSPILAVGARVVFMLYDVSTTWRSQWKLFSCPLARLTGGWAPIDRASRGDVFEILKRPRLLPGAGGARPHDRRSQVVLRPRCALLHGAHPPAGSGHHGVGRG
ncbi:SKP1-interacting partner 15 [Hordeum vulgare]|nr:SKP1-interacting partner 15 [Hordeum vulgare]